MASIKKRSKPDTGGPDPKEKPLSSVACLPQNPSPGGGSSTSCKDTEKCSPAPVDDSATTPSGRKLCFLKFYNNLYIEEKEQWIDNLRNNMTSILLFNGFDRIKLMYESLAKESARWRIIYSHRHMGATMLLEAIKIVWTGNYDGQKDYYNRTPRKDRLCKLVSFNNSADELVIFLDDNLKKWFAKLPNKPKDNCPCEAVEEAIIGEIKAEILKYVKAECDCALADMQKEKKLLLLDDFDVHLCQLYKSYSDTYNSYKIWFYRKCWIKAVLSLNTERIDLAISLVLLTNLKEYKVHSYKEDEQKWVQNPGFGYLGRDISYDESVFDLYDAYNSIISSFKDACFFKCKPNDNKEMYECSYLGTEENCKFALSQDYWHDKSMPDGKIDSDKVKHIEECVLLNRYSKVNNNPWWLIVPLTHLFSTSRSCLYNDADTHLKNYYKGQNDGCLGMRKSGNILDEFFATLPLYCQVDCSFDGLLSAQKDFSNIVLKRLMEGHNDVELKRPSTDGHSEKSEKKANIMVKMMLEDSGLVVRISDEDAKNDKFNLHPFVCYVYSKTEKYFEKE